MRHYSVMVAALVLLALVTVAGADETVIPDANWTPTPPASATLDTSQLLDILVKKQVITLEEKARLMGRSRETARDVGDYRKSPLAIR